MATYTNGSDTRELWVKTGTVVYKYTPREWNFATTLPDGSLYLERPGGLSTVFARGGWLVLETNNEVMPE